MAFEYFLYSTNYNNTLIDRGASSFAPLPANTGEVYIDFLIPNTQPLYLYKESSGLIVLNDDETINTYLNGIGSPTGEDPVDQNQFTGYTGQTDGNLVYISGQTDTKIDKVTGATGNLAIFLADGNVEDSGVTIDSITGGTGFYFYEDRTARINNTTTTDVIYISGTSEILQAGTWSLDFNALGGNIGNNKSIVVGFYVDNVLLGVENSIQANASTNIIPFSLTKDGILTSGTHVFEVRFRQLGGGTAFLEYASVRARLVS